MHSYRTVKFGVPGENSQQTNDVILINDDDDEEDHQIQPPTNDAKLLKSASNDSLDSDSLPDLDEDMSTQKSVKKELIREKPGLYLRL